MWSLGELYEKGVGVSQNFSEAYIWYNLAVASGNSFFREARDLAAKKLSPQELELAQAKSRKIQDDIRFMGEQ